MSITRGAPQGNRAAVGVLAVRLVYTRSMAGLPWHRRGTFKRHRTLAQLDGAAVALAVVERHEDDDTWWGRDYDCGDHCDMCIPDWRDRDEKLRQLARDRPTFSLADRLLAQVGLVLRLGR